MAVLGSGADNGDVLSISHRAFDLVRTRVNRALGRHRFMEYNRYPANRVVSTLKEIGYEDIELRIFRITATGLRQSFFFGRKPSR